MPPLPEYIGELMTDWENYVNRPSQVPTLVRAAMSHYQFETIHPFLDGNGRIGRLLVGLFLMSTGRLTRPLLYLSGYLEANRSEYYERLQGIRERAEVQEYLQFFFVAVRRQSEDAVRERVASSNSGNATTGRWRWSDRVWQRSSPHLRYAVHPCAPNRAVVRELRRSDYDARCAEPARKGGGTGLGLPVRRSGKGFPALSIWLATSSRSSRPQRITSNRFSGLSSQISMSSSVVTTVLRSERVFLRMARP